MMMLSEAAAALHGDLVGTDARFESVSSDTRTLEKSGLFVALAGERFDGHHYLGAAAAAGAAGALIERGAREVLAGACSLPLVCVNRSREGLGQLAAYWRARFRHPVVTIVGSNGKTTTKEMTASILRAQFGAAQVAATAGNLNNDIGLPLTVLRLRSHHRVAVLEIGMNHAGETAVLAAIASPSIGVINNAQREHQEFMASVEAVAAEHATLIDALPRDGVAVLNADDPHFGYWRDRAGSRRIVGFGLSPQASVTAAVTTTASGSDLAIQLPQGEARATLRIPGEHNVRNALAAAAAASAAGADPESIGAGLSAFEPAKGRLQLKHGRGGALVIDDTYNANPDSVRAAIDVLSRAGGASILVLGDMGEVGDQGLEFHREVGIYARARGITRLFALGDGTAESARAFGAGATHFLSVEALVEGLAGQLASGVTLLVKGSRFMRMERVVDALVEPGA